MILEGNEEEEEEVEEMRHFDIVTHKSCRVDTPVMSHGTANLKNASNRN